MKIAFVGDSYCADTSMAFDSATITNSWLNLVLKEYNAEMVCKGRGGTALFHAYEDLLGIVDEADYIIFCISDAHRIPNRFGIPIDGNWLTSKLWNFKTLLANVPEGIEYHNGREILGQQHKKAIKAGELYYKNLISFDFHQVAQKGILMQMDELMLQKKKKCIWFPCFEDELSMQKYIPKSGPIASHDLCYIAQWEIAKEYHAPHSLIKESNESGSTFRPDPDLRYNHFSLRNNQNMANLIINMINNNDFTPRKIKMEKYFEILE